MLLFYIASFAVIATGCFILGFYILSNDRSSRINRLFFLNSILLNAVILFTIFTQLPDEIYYVKLFQSIYNIILILFLIESLYFNLVFTKQKLNHFSAVLLSLFSGIVFVIFIIYGQNLFYITKVNGLWVYELVNFRFWFFLYTPLLFLIAALMLFYLFRFSRNALLNKEKIQAKTIMISISAACACGFCFLMIFPVFGIYKIPLLTPYFFAVYLFGVFYAINRYRFLSFGIKDISNEVLSYIKDIIIIMKPDKTIMDSNSNFSLLLGQNSDFFAGRDIMELIEYNESFSGALDELIEGKINSFSSRIVYKNQPENIVTDSSVLRIQDKFGDFAAILIVSMENRGVSQFRKHFKITEREMEIIYLTTSGLTNKDISEKLKIAERTVETHLGNIYNKLGINNKVELLRITGEFSV